MYRKSNTKPTRLGDYIRTYRRELNLSCSEFDRLYEYKRGIRHLETEYKPVTNEATPALVDIFGTDILPVIREHNRLILALRYPL